MARVLRAGAALSADEHRLLAGHFNAIQHHASAIMDMLSGKALVKWIDVCIKAFNLGAFAPGLRSALDDEYMASYDVTSPYYGSERFQGACSFTAADPERHA